MILVSACLAGRHCRYNGAACADRDIVRMVHNGAAVAVCPEELGGLTIPRPPAEIADGADGGDVLDGRARVTDKGGRDVTANFVAGARLALVLARRAKATRAILKSGSPSCGVDGIYDGTFSGKIRAGNGVTAELLRRHGIEVVADTGHGAGARSDKLEGV